MGVNNSGVPTQLLEFPNGTRENQFLRYPGYSEKMPIYSKKMEILRKSGLNWISRGVVDKGKIAPQFPEGGTVVPKWVFGAWWAPDVLAGAWEIAGSAPGIQAPVPPEGLLWS